MPWSRSKPPATGLPWPLDTPPELRSGAPPAQAGGPVDDRATEDYQLTYRLLARGARDGVVPVVAAVPGAQVCTEAPRTLAGFVRQRTRWFAGFLSPLARFRGLVGERRAGAFGLVRLPLKVAEATLPVLTRATLLTGLRAALRGASSRRWPTCATPAAWPGRGPGSFCQRLRERVLRAMDSLETRANPCRRRCPVGAPIGHGCSGVCGSSRTGARTPRARRFGVPRRSTRDGGTRGVSSSVTRPQPRPETGL